MKRGAKPKKDKKRIQLPTTITIQADLFEHYGWQYWAGIIRDFIKSKESEIEKA
jgi:hypothetical protein